MSNNNKTRFMKDSSNHIANLNRAIKLEVMVDFICLDQSGVTIVTNKIASPLDLQTIENYIKSTNCIEAKEVEVPCLP